MEWNLKLYLVPGDGNGRSGGPIYFVTVPQNYDPAAAQQSADGAATVKEMMA